MKRVLIVEDEQMTAGLLKQTVDACKGILQLWSTPLREFAASVASPFPYDCALFDIEL